MAKRPPLPLILTANELIEGDVVYYDGQGWSRDRARALVAADEPAAEALEDALGASGGIVVEPYLIEAAQAHYRERIRLSGPTIAYGEEASHVSL